MTKRRTPLKLAAKIKRMSVIKNLGGKCAMCGDERYDVLQLDHIERTENGKRHIEKGSIKARHSASQVVQRLITGKAKYSDFQVLCANCHMIKSRRNEEYCEYKGERISDNDLFKQLKLF